MKTFLVTQWFHLLIYATLNVAIPTHKELWKPAPIRIKTDHRIMAARVFMKTPSHTDLDWTPHIDGLHDYLYQFHGRAMYKGRPAANASVVLRLTTKRDSIVRGAITDADGNYTIEMMVCGKNTEAVRWVMQSYTPDSQPVELEGSRIILQEDERIVVQNGQDLLAS